MLIDFIKTSNFRCERLYLYQGRNWSNTSTQRSFRGNSPTWIAREEPLEGKSLPTVFHLWFCIFLEHVQAVRSSDNRVLKVEGTNHWRARLKFETLVKVKSYLSFLSANRGDLWGSGSVAISFLTSALGECEWPASRPGRFNAEKRAIDTYWIGMWLGPGAGLDAVEKRNLLTLPGIEFRLLSPSRILVTVLTKVFEVEHSVRAHGIVMVT